MQIDMSGVIYSLSYALDCIEAEFVGVSVDHAKWVAYLSVVIGRQYGLTSEELADLSVCAALHDNALTQYLSKDGNGLKTDENGDHSRYGEANVLNFPFHTNTKGFILYHHENADGSGPFGKTPDEIPIQAQIIHLADMIDVDCKFHIIDSATYANIKAYLSEQCGSMYTREIIDSFFAAMPESRYMSLKDRAIDDILNDELPHVMEEYTFDQVKAVMDVFGQIVDYKSSFTQHHSNGIAQKAYIMAQSYGYDTRTCERLYIAGTLHDIGKLAIGNDILEKPGRLTDDELSNMKNHALYTHLILSRIYGFDDITEWASSHHEKLDGSGYPNGKTADQLSKNDRLLACVDIYQALSEDRPYKPGMPHAQCISIMRDMVSRNFIDGDITDDIDRVFGGAQ